MARDDSLSTSKAYAEHFSSFRAEPAREAPKN